ncbi:MAG: hypothetical protein ABSD27_04340 [Bryobacteraceae bacterium]|jgi:hypothetical protein
MAKESKVVEIAKDAAERFLAPPLSIRRGEALLYQVTVDNELNLTVDPKRPVRGNSAFQTDLCVFEEKRKALFMPRVVMEFKARITTHDVLTYSAKARKHKQVYPYLRYGLVVSDEAFVPGRVFTHNEALDFCATIANYKGARLSKILEELLENEVECSRRLEAIGFGKARTHLFRTEVIFESGGAKIR